MGSDYRFDSDYSRRGILAPCPINLTFQSGVFDFENNLLLDKDRVRANDAALISSNCLDFNGVDNTINLGVNNVGNYTDNFTLFAKGKFAKVQRIFRRQVSGNKRQYDFYIGPTGNLTFFWTRDDTSSAIVVLPAIDISNANVEIAISINSNGTSFFYIDGVTYNTSTISGLFNHDGGYTDIGRTDTGAQSCHIFQGICNKALSITELDNLFAGERENLDIELMFDFSEGSGTKVYDRASTSAYIVQGTLTNIWNTKQDLYHSNLENGFSFGTSGLVRIPSSLSNPTLDVLGNPLTNPASLNAHNLAETIIILPSSGETDFVNIEDDPDWQETVFARAIENTEEVTVKYDRILDYSTAPVDDCKLKTLKYTQ